MRSTAAVLCALCWHRARIKPHGGWFLPGDIQSLSAPIHPSSSIQQHPAGYNGGHLPSPALTMRGQSEAKSSLRTNHSLFLRHAHQLQWTNDTTSSSPTTTPSLCSSSSTATHPFSARCSEIWLFKCQFYRFVNAFLCFKYSGGILWYLPCHYITSTEVELINQTLIHSSKVGVFHPSEFMIYHEAPLWPLFDDKRKRKLNCWNVLINISSHIQLTQRWFRFQFSSLINAN